MAGADQSAVLEGEQVRVSHRRRTPAKKANQDAEPVTCFCGGTDFDYSFVRFPMAHVSRCRACGLEPRGELKMEPAPVRAGSSQAGQPPIAFPPFWY